MPNRNSSCRLGCAEYDGDDFQLLDYLVSKMVRCADFGKISKPYNCILFKHCLIFTDKNSAHNVLTFLTAAASN